MPAAPPVSRPLTAQRQLGRIRITRQYDSNVYYLYNQLNPHGFFTLVTDPSQALVIQPEPAATSRWRLRITEVSVLPSFDMSKLPKHFSGSKSQISILGHMVEGNYQGQVSNLTCVNVPNSLILFCSYAALCASNPHLGTGSASARSFKGSLLRDIWRPSSGGASGGVISRKLSAMDDKGTSVARHLDEPIPDTVSAALGDLFAYSSGSTDTLLFRMTRLRSSQLVRDYLTLGLFLTNARIESPNIFSLVNLPPRIFILN